MAAHTHDGLDWASRLGQLRRADEVDAPALREVAERLIDRTPPGSTVLDVGCGAGGMSAALAAAMARRGGGTLVLVDAVPELLAAATEAALAAAAPGATASASASAPAVAGDGGGAGHRGDGRTGGGAGAAGAGAASASGAGAGLGAASAAGVAGAGVGAAGAAAAGVAGTRAGASGGAGAGAAGVRGAGIGGGGAGATGGRGLGRGGGVARGGRVEVRGVLGDLAGGRLRELVPAARLVWASRVVHHLPDQQAGLAALADLLVPGGCLALAEGGLAMRCLPWDVGVGEPGLGDRLTARRDAWFASMRAAMPDGKRLPVGWNRALAEVGLVGMTSFSFLVDRPAPLSPQHRQSVIDWLTWMADAIEAGTSGTEDAGTADAAATDTAGADAAATNTAATDAAATDTVAAAAAADVEAVRRLLDPADPAYVGARDDVFLLKATTVHLGWAR